MYCIDIKTGQELWRFSTNGGIQGQTIYQNKVFFGTSDGYLFCVDINSGQETWKYEFNRFLFRNTLNNPLIYNGKIYHINGGNIEGYVFTNISYTYLYCNDMITGKEIWKFNIDGIDGTSPSISDGKGFKRKND